MTNVLSMGPVYTLTMDVQYALPPRSAQIAVYTSGGTISTSVDKTNWQTITLDANNEFYTASAFIRSTGAGSVVAVKGF